MSIQGARNRASGAFFEDAILRVCRHYWLSGQAAIDKTPEEGAAYRLPVTMGLLLFLDPKDYDHER